MFSLSSHIGVRQFLVAGACASTLSGSIACYAATVANSESIADQTSGANWLSVGRTYTESRYSPLASINDGNVGNLGLAWFMDLPNQGALQATPLATDGTLYFTGIMGHVYATDGRTGCLLWEFDPDVAHHVMNRHSVLWNVNRGVALWKSKVYVGTADGRLMALDAKTGAVVWSVQTFDESDYRKTISGAPRVFNGKVIIGHGGEFGTRGYVTTYDAETGRKLWRFYTVPGDPAKGFENEAMAMEARTWHGQWWKEGGNGTVWDSITYDPDFNRVYLATANGTPVDANKRGTGGGDNLFVASIVALDADTGEYVWHYQVNPGEMWEYDATAQMVLAELPIGGEVRKVLMQAPKNGFLYVIDRTNGQLISAEKLGKVTWAERIDLKSGRPVEVPGIRYRDDQDVPVVIRPSALGMHNWQAMSFNPLTHLVYIPARGFGVFVLASGINAAPMTYAVDGVQYVAVLVGYGGTINVTRVHDYGWRYGEQPRRILAFALGKSTPLPLGKPPRFNVQPIDDPSFIIDAKSAVAGAQLYGECAGCHGIDMHNLASFARDLRESPLATTWGGFKSVVHDGALIALGMPKFDDLSEQELRALYMYVTSRTTTPGCRVFEFSQVE